MKNVQRTHLKQNIRFQRMSQHPELREIKAQLYNYHTELPTTTASKVSNQLRHFLPASPLSYQQNRWKDHCFHVKSDYISLFKCGGPTRATHWKNNRTVSQSLGWAHSGLTTDIRAPVNSVANRHHPTNQEHPDREWCSLRRGEKTTLDGNTKFIEIHGICSRK